MTPEEIKKETEAQYAAIRLAEQRLSDLRAICRHENKYEGNWAWRPGSHYRALICSDCGSCIQNLDMNQVWTEERSGE